MGSVSSKMVWSLGKLLLLVSLLLCPASAFAHKLYVFARLEGATIHGRAYFPGDVPAQHIDVIARDPSGRELGRTTTDDKGNFLFTARKRVDHCLTAETPDGHAGQYTVHAAALPDSLSADGATDAGGPQIASPATDHAGAPVPAAGKDPESAAVGDQLAELGRQIDDLRQQVYDSEERLRLRDLLGGIGFILGLAGVAFYMQARRRRP